MQFGSSTNRDVYCISQQVQICVYVCVCVYIYICWLCERWNLKKIQLQQR